jgi:transposase
MIVTTAAEDKNEARGCGPATSNRISVYPGTGLPFLRFYPKERDMARYVGIDLAKRKMDVCILADGKIERHSFKTDAEGRRRLRGLLRKTDVVGMEMCCCSALLTREIEREIGCRVFNLNAGALQIIWKSRKKTDREDALKIAKYVRDTPEEELVTVEVPSGEEEAFRGEISLAEFVKKERTAAINRLHSLYAQSGITDAGKKDLKESEGRALRRGELPAPLAAQALMLEEQITMFEKQLEQTAEKVRERVQSHELAPYVMSIPGIGLWIAAALLAYLGNWKRFENAGQVANYAGRTPRVDCSGDTERYGSIAKYSCCKAIRRVVIEGVWSLARSGNGGPLQAKFHELSGRMSKKKSAVAIARKMVTLAWLLMKRREYYAGTDEAALARKLKFYKAARAE